MITTDNLKTILKWLEIWYEKKGHNLKTFIQFRRTVFEAYTVYIEIEERNGVGTVLVTTFITSNFAGEKLPINKGILEIIARIDEHIDNQWHIIRSNDGYLYADAKYPKTNEEVLVIDTYCKYDKEGAFQAQWDGNYWKGSNSIAFEFGLGSDLSSVSATSEIYAWRRLPKLTKLT